MTRETALILAIATCGMAAALAMRSVGWSIFNGTILAAWAAVAAVEIRSRR